MAKKKDNARKGKAIWITNIGSIKSREFNIVKNEKEKFIISFSNKEAYRINKNHIRGGKIIIFEKEDGNIITMDPEDWCMVDLKAKGIKTLRFNLQNSSLQESKSALYRWTSPKDRVDKLIPVFKLMFICIAIGVMGWAALKFGGLALDTITRSRLMDCVQLLPKIQTPVGAIMNRTVPLGAT